MDTLYHGAPARPGDAPATGDNYRYKRIWGLHPFRGPHPLVMQRRVNEKKWKWDLHSSPLEWEVADAKKIVLDTLEKWTGRRLFEYRSYRVVK